MYKIDGKTGAVMWTLGGKKSDFTLGDGAAFNWEHYVRWIEEGSVLSLFDNEGWSQAHVLTRLFADNVAQAEVSQARPVIVSGGLCGEIADIY